MGTHQLNCKKWAGRSWGRGHDLIVKALAYEVTQLGLGVVDKDSTMKANHSHLNSKERGDIAFSTDGQLEITNIVDRLPRSELIVDVKMVAVVFSTGDLLQSGCWMLWRFLRYGKMMLHAPKLGCIRKRYTTRGKRYTTQRRGAIEEWRVFTISVLEFTTPARSGGKRYTTQRRQLVVPSGPRLPSGGGSSTEWRQVIH
jgi:hypothetical protein